MGEFVNGIAIKGEHQFHILEAENAEENAKAISLERECPVLSAYIYDGDYWGYTLYINGEIRNEFATLPEYFEEGKGVIRQYTANVLLLSQSFTVAIERIEKYLYHWTDAMINEGSMAYEDDEFPYGDAWQLIDFLGALGFTYPEDISNGQADMQLPQLPTLREILEKNIPPNAGEFENEEYPLIDKLPSAFSFDYIRHLLEQNDIREFQFMDKTPPDIIETILKYCISIQQSEKDSLCQRLHVLAAFCSYWMCRGNGWTFLDYATYEPVCLNYEKPTDVYVLRARAAITGFTKRHRALRDLSRLLELDSENAELYLGEIAKWEEKEREWRNGLKNR